MATALQHVFIAALGGISGLSILAGILWLAKLGIEKLLSHFLERKLSDFKYEQNQEIEKLKNALGHIGDRGIRSNELEYQALIATWERFIDAYYATFGAIGGFRQRPDLKCMSDDEVQKWLDATDFSQINKEHILHASDKNEALGRIERIIELNDCQNAIWKAQQTLRHKAVFIPASIEEQFDEALTKLRQVWVESKMNTNHSRSVPINNTMNFINTEETKDGMRARLRDTVRSRVLHDLSTSADKSSIIV